MSSEQENKAIVRSFCELENRGDLDALFASFPDIFLKSIYY
jgi:hypothetical protein